MSRAEDLSFSDKASNRSPSMIFTSPSCHIKLGIDDVINNNNINNINNNNLNDEDEALSLPSYALALEMENRAASVSLYQHCNDPDLKFVINENVKTEEIEEKNENVKLEECEVVNLDDRMFYLDSFGRSEFCSEPSSPPPEYDISSRDLQEEILRIISANLTRISRRLK
jgi:hypothetical protein